ncbi:MAG: SIS domain-containing protein [Opitutaceae bacterium]|nr:SIS domain-containing protein [Opitutaceae bacterium]
MSETPFEKELAEMPDALERLVRAHLSDPGPVARWLERLGSVRRVLALGMGTSSFSLHGVGRGLSRRGIAFHQAEAGEWFHNGDILAPGELPILCSQSGASAEIVRLLDRGLPISPVAVTNDAASPLANGGDPVFLLHAGPERAISAKTYANTLATARILEAATAGVPLAACSERLLRVAESLQETGSGAVQHAANLLQHVPTLAVVGRTDAVPAVLQFALTCAEGVGRVATPFLGGSFRHGPMEACGPDLGVIAFTQADRCGDLVLRAADEAVRLGCRVVVFTDRSDVPDALTPVPVPRGDDPADFSLRCSRMQAQFIHALAALRGREAGIFRVNSKVTQVE